MADDKKRRRRRGRRGGQGRSPGEPQGEQQPGAQPDAERASAESTNGGRPARRDTRRGRGGAPQPEGPPSPSNPSIRRAPSAGERTPRQREPERRDRGERNERGRPQRESRDGRDRDRSRRDGGMRMLEAPPPPDPLSIELGQKFREAQTAVRDARKALDKRRAEFNDEPEWMVAQLEEAERNFEEASTAWVEHLSKTGRKMARR